MHPPLFLKKSAGYSRAFVRESLPTGHMVSDHQQGSSCAEPSCGQNFADRGVYSHHKETGHPRAFICSETTGKGEVSPKTGVLPGVPHEEGAQLAQATVWSASLRGDVPQL